MYIPYPITTYGLPITMARALLMDGDEDQISDALRSAYTTGYMDAIARCDLDAEWDRGGV